MAAKVKRLQPKPADRKPILSTPQGRYAPDWDSPKVQFDRVLKPGENRTIGAGPSGITRGS